MSQPKQPQAAEPLRGPRWARAVHIFYDPILDVRSKKGFQDAVNEFVQLPGDERAFHQTHLLYRLVLGVEDLCERLDRVEARVDEASQETLHQLAGIRGRLAEIAESPFAFASEADFDGEPEEPEEPEDGEPGEDPDIIYDSIPDEPTAPPPRAASRRATPEEPAPPPKPPKARPPSDADAGRELLIGDLVPATEGPHGAET